MSATLTYDVGEGDDAVETPAVGVAFTVTAGDEEVGTGETDDEGVFLLEVPGPGGYTVAVDPDTLPDGVELVDPDTLSRTVEVSPQETQRVLFALQEEGAVSTSNAKSDVDRFLQLTVEGIKFGLVIAMMAVGLSLIFGTTGLTNFAHGEMVVVGTILVWYLNDAGIWLPFATLIGLIVMFGAGAGFDRGVVASAPPPRHEPDRHAGHQHRRVPRHPVPGALHLRGSPEGVPRLRGADAV